jgi:hypothetical protein
VVARPVTDPLPEANGIEGDASGRENDFFALLGETDIYDHLGR